MEKVQVQEVEDEVSAIENWEPSKRRRNSSHEVRKTYDRPGIRISDIGDSKYPGPHDSTMYHGGRRQTSQNRMGEEENAMEGRALATKKPRGEEV
ncbi:hypothetical protein R1flu_018270 [Riccia fluitans]|uniref:Uncharacterized protein n=1 Tax=Riccia fluitans TaxID=41844 RepID=A0ABD1ZFJ5_9MARC